MAKKSTSLVKLPVKNYALMRVEYVDNFVDISPHFYNQRLLNQFKKLLKDNNVDFTYSRTSNSIDLIGYNIILICSKYGRFYAQGRHPFRGHLSFNFEANSPLEIIHKLLRFRLINGKTAKRFVSAGPKETRKTKQNRLINKHLSK